MKKLSIIIPVYNVEEYIIQCLDSVFAQGLNSNDYEVICVNDGSTDNSIGILESYSKQFDNIRIISQNNAGLSVARNTGLDAATGDYIFFLDSDDWIFQGKLADVLNRVDGEDVVYFNATRYYDDENVFDTEHEITEYNNISGTAYLSLVENQKRYLPYVCVCWGLYKRTFLLENNLYNEPGIYHEDSLFTPQVLLQAQLVSCVNICLYSYRIHQGSITTTVNRKHIEDMLFVCRELYHIFRNKEQYVDDVFYRYISTYYAVTITEAYKNHQALQPLWAVTDSKVMLRYANNGLIRRMAKLSFLSTKLSYRYGQNQLRSFARKFVNRFL